MLTLNHDLRPDTNQILKMRPFCDWAKGRESPDYRVPRIKTGVQISARERVGWLGTNINLPQKEAAIYSISPYFDKANQAKI